MRVRVPLDEDYHVHSTYSDGASTLAANVRTAGERGLRRLCLTDHVRSGTTWLPEYVAEVRSLGSAGPDLVTGVEAKILDGAGRMDLPPDLTGIELVLVADHQFPARRGPVHPAEVSTALARGTASAGEVIGALIVATAAALAGVAALAGPRPVLAHLFSLLPKLGLDEDAVPDAGVELLAQRAAGTGALLEINEKWGCPSARTVTAFASAGVTVVAGSDSHDQAGIGLFPAVRRTIAAVAAGRG